MFNLQGTWVPRSAPDQQPIFFLWGEQQAGRIPYTTLEVDDIVNGVNAIIGQERALIFSNEKVRACLLLSNDESMVPSANDADNELISGIGIQFKMGTIADSLALLLSFAQAELWEPWGFIVGELLDYWQKVAKLTLELLASEHYMPSIDPSELSAFWDGVVDDPRIEHRIHSLATTIPSQHERIADFIKISLDLFVRESFNNDEVRLVMKRMNPRYVAALTPSEHWLHALFAMPSEAHDPSLEWISDEVGQWRKGIVGMQNDISFRTCFRLAQPNPTELTEDAEPVWQLQILLQAADDPSLLVSAGEVWREATETLEYLNYRFPQPQERLLADLGKAAKLFTPLARSLKHAQPTVSELSTEEAHYFLAEAAERLSSAGFGIFIPSWWRNPAAQLGVKMKVYERQKIVENRALTYRKNTMGFNALMDYEWQLALGEDDLSLAELEQLAALKQPLVQVRGQWIEFQPAYWHEAVRLLDHKGEIKLADMLHLALDLEPDGQHPLLNRREQSASLFDDVGDQPHLLAIQGVTAGGELEQLIQQLKSDRTMDVLQQPLQLQGTLRPYQVKGFSWLVFMRQLQLGTCLADDMGLGKTIQWIAYILHLKEHGELQGPVVLVCPTSVIMNWELELARFAPSLDVWVHHGAARLKGDDLMTKVHQVDIVLTSYAIVMRDEVDFVQIDWDIVTLDEAQNIKNTSAKQTQSIRKLAAYHRIALTGTPVENRLTELWSIMDFLNPGYLGTRDQFIETFEVPIERDDEVEKTQSLHRIIQPFLLRRLKSDRKVISDLPNKDEYTAYCTLTREQASLYEACIKTAFANVEKASGIERRGIILSTITHLKQICNHPAHYLGEGELEEHRSGKLIRLVKKLYEAMEQGERVLIFTQYARMAMLLQQFLMSRFQQEVLLIHGRVPKKKRDEMILRFQEDADAPSIFVLSLKTGGFGLNLTRANQVIHYDRWWNPAVENQATDRAYRIGQQRNVKVHKFVCAGTLEEKIDQMMVTKQSLATRVIGKGEAWITEMNTDQLKELLTLRNDMLAPETIELEGSAR